MKELEGKTAKHDPESDDAERYTDQTNVDINEINTTSLVKNFNKTASSKIISVSGHVTTLIQGIASPALMKDNNPLQPWFLYNIAPTFQLAFLLDFALKCFFSRVYPPFAGKKSNCVNCLQLACWEGSLLTRATK